MSEKTEEFSADATADNNEEDTGITTMVEVLEQQKELEEAYAVVLGASDEKRCTYSQGAIKRQALYSCITCCPEVRNDLTKAAGICLACSYGCHENHELIELYTKRNFRCDCPTIRMGDKRCALNSDLSQQQQPNEANLYNQNFQGLYCKCKRSYPDPERTTEEMMVQCTICEDWYHLPHINATDADGKMASSEMICDDCMEKHDFLHDYIGLALKPVVDLNDSTMNVSVTDDDSTCKNNDDNKLKSELDKSIADILNINPEDTKDSEESKNKENDVKQSEDGDNTVESPPQKRLKTDDESQNKDETIECKSRGSACRRPSIKRDNEKGATFWGENWRNELCKCVECLELYKREQVEFLLDEEDSPIIYEERGKKRIAENSTYEQGIRALASIGHTQQIDAITEYNRMRDKLKEFLQTFAENDKIVTAEDINGFFERFRNENNSNIGKPYLRH